MNGAIPPALQYAFMVWCLVKTRAQLYQQLSEKGEDVCNGSRKVVDNMPFLTV
jgi:hypothetical protein